MYPYHNKIKQRIAAGELVAHYYTDSYPRIGQALVLVFNTAPFKRPIRPHRFTDYQSIIGGEHFATHKTINSKPA